MPHLAHLTLLDHRSLLIPTLMCLPAKAAKTEAMAKAAKEQVHAQARTKTKAKAVAKAKAEATGELRAKAMTEVVKANSVLAMKRQPVVSW